MEISRRHKSSSSMGSNVRVMGAPSAFQSTPRPEERPIGPRLEGWATNTVLAPTLRDASPRDAPQGEAMPFRRMPTSLANLRQDGAVGQQARPGARADDECALVLL